MSRLKLVLLGLLLVLFSKLNEYATSAHRGDSPTWFSDPVVGHRSEIAFIILVLSLSAALLETFQAHFEEKHRAKPFLKRILDIYAARHSPKAERRNRLTVFKVTTGWVAIWNSLRRFQWIRSKWVFFRCLRLRPHYTYLGVYVRSSEARNVRSATFLRISDNAEECDGMAGRVWEDGFCQAINLTPITAEQIRLVKSILELSEDDPVRRYATDTNLWRPKQLPILKAMKHPARHFVGELIKRTDGKRWGVLLLDSEDPACPVLPGSSNPADEWLKECATELGSLVS